MKMIKLSQRREVDRMVDSTISRRSLFRAAPAVAISIGSLSRFDSPGSAAPSGAATPESQNGDDEYDLGAAVTWLVDQQLPDGGFPGPSGASDPETTIDVVMLGARPSARNGLAHDYLLAHGPAYAAMGPGQSAKLVLAAIALHEDPTAFGGRGEATAASDCAEFSSGGVDLMRPIVAAIAAQAPEAVLPWVDVDAADLERATSITQASGAIPGAFGRDLRDHAYGLLALSAYPLLGEFPKPKMAIAPFVATQAANGGWAVDGAADLDAADARTTALVLQALADWERRDAPIVQRGLAFLRSLQVPDGGFAFDQSESRVADAASTALAMQALMATSEFRTAPVWGNAPRALARFQLPSGGFLLRMTDDEPDLPATLQAMLVLSNRYLPVRYFCS